MLLKIVRPILRVAPNFIAFPIVKALAARTQRPLIAPVEQDALSYATRISYGDGGRNVAWTWGAGPIVIFVHGWSGRAAQMAPLAMHVSTLGFRSVAIEVTGHGSSPGKETSWKLFFQDITALAAALGGEVYAYVGHSAGALTMMATRKLSGLSAQKYVCICAPSHPFPSIVLIKKILNPHAETVNSYKKYLADQFQTRWEDLEAGNSFAGLGSKTLFIYDTSDRFVPHSEGDKLMALCSTATLEKLNKYGHVDILAAPELNTALKRFLPT
jgi:pimeloyl-ACP methyl ester carboxylesterase